MGRKEVYGALRLQAWKSAVEKLGESDMERRQKNIVSVESKEYKGVVLDQDITMEEEVKQIMDNLKLQDWMV